MIKLYRVYIYTIMGFALLEDRLREEIHLCNKLFIRWNSENYLLKIATLNNRNKHRICVGIDPFFRL